jgi:hypothetical protein
MGKNSIADILNDKESRDRILAEAKAQISGGIFDLLPQCGLDGKPIQSVENAVRLSSMPAREEIDYSRTSDRMIVEGRAFLKDGREVAW